MNKHFQLFSCPACKHALELEIFKSDRDGHCEDGVLRCEHCHNHYVVSNGIPRLFVPGDLRPDESGFLSKYHKQMKIKNWSRKKSVIKTKAGKSQVQSGFGHKWTRQSWWGMEGESAKVMAEWLLPRYGWKSSRAYQQFMKTKRVILDAGCGLGRETLRMAKANPDAFIIGLELSECVDEAAQHARKQGINNIQYIQADLTNPPFKNKTFEFIISEGVLHHTPDTKMALQSLARLLKLNGEIAFYVYRKKAPLREFADDYIRNLVKDLPPEQAWKALEPLTQLGKVLTEMKAIVKIPKTVDFLGIKAGKYDLQRLIYYTMFKCYWNDRLSFQENVHINFDWYYPQFAWRHTEEEIHQWLDKFKLELVHEHIEESGITIRAIRHH